MLVRSYTRLARERERWSFAGETDTHPRQREVVQLIAESYGGKPIASRFNISSRTVETPRSVMLR